MLTDIDLSYDQDLINEIYIEFCEVCSYSKDYRTQEDITKLHQEFLHKYSL